jgi:prephenate dehydrogenase
MIENKLNSITLIGLGLLGGSLGLAIQRAFPTAKRLGYSHRKTTRQKAINAEAVDQVFDKLPDAVKQSQLVILCTPVGLFEEIFQKIAQHLPTGCIVTDVGSTKASPAQWAKKTLPPHVEFLGSHPIAGSEQRGIDFSRADLFDNASCIITPTAENSKKTQTFISQFWKKIGMKVKAMTPEKHDQLLARISHLPHLLAMALVNNLDPKETLMCGKGFLDTTRVASGDPTMWRDILMANANHTDQAITQLINELKRSQTALRQKDDQAIFNMLTQAQNQRNKLVATKLRRKELPA